MFLFLAERVEAVALTRLFTGWLMYSVGNVGGITVFYQGGCLTNETPMKSVPSDASDAYQVTIAFEIGA